MEPSSDAVEGPHDSDCTQSVSDTKPETSKTIGISLTDVVDPFAQLKGQRIGDYEIIDEIAHGGMGVVYKANQVSLNRIVALKMVLSGQFASEAEVKRFLAEAEAVAHLDHPNIVSIYEVGIFEGRHYFTMKFLDGGSVADKTSAYLDEPRKAAELLSVVAQGVHFAHQRGILHRDLKPPNILLDQSGRPHITDFGLAKKMESGPELTQSGAVMGTPHYMAPEQARGKTRNATTATDIYSLGAILFELLTGRPPFTAESPLEVLRQTVEESPPRPANLNPKVDLDLETICLKCLEKDPAQRYGSAEALAEDLDRWLRNEPISARPATTLQLVIKYTKRKPVVTGLMAATAVSLLLGLIGILWQWRQAEQARQIADEKSRSLRHSLYLADLNLADQAIEKGNLGRAAELLNKYASPSPGEQDLRTFEWHLLNSQTKGDEIRSFTVPPGLVAGIQFSPDGQWLGFTHATRGESYLKNLSPNVQNIILATKAFSFLPDSNGVIFVNGDHFAIYNLVTGSTNFHPLPIADSVGFSADYRTIYTFTSNSIFFFDYPSLKPAGKMGRNDRTRLTWTRDSKFLLTDFSGIVQLWDSRPNRLIKSYDEVKSIFGSATISPDGSLISYITFSGQLTTLDAATGSNIWTVQAHQGSSFGIRHTLDNQFLISAGSDHLVNVWKARTGQKFRTYRGHQNEAWSIAVAPDGVTFATTGKDGAARLWRLEAKREGQQTLANQIPLAFMDDGRLLAQNNADGNLVCVDPNSLEIKQKIEPIPRVHTEAFSKFAGIAHLRWAAVSPQGNRLAVGSFTNNFDLWALPERKLITNFLQSAKPVAWMEISDDGKWSAQADFSGHVSICNLVLGKEIKVLPNSKAPLRFSSDGKFLAACDRDYNVLLWDLNPRNLTPEKHFKGHEWHLQTILFTRDSRFLITGAHDNTARIWNIETGAELAVLRGHKAAVFSATLSPDERTLATGSLDDTIVLWDLASRSQKISLRENGGDILDLRFSKDGKILAALVQNERQIHTKLWRTGSE